MYLEEKWQTMYALAEEYFQEHKNLEIPARYKVEKGGIIYGLGEWVCRQRRLKELNELPLARAEKLDKLHMRWNKLVKVGSVYNWDFYYNLLKGYYHKHGNIDLASNYTVTYNGQAIGLERWLNLQKQKYRAKNLQLRYILLLEELGINWQIKKSKRPWVFYYDLCVWYFQKHQNLLIPTNYEIKVFNDAINDFETIKLGRWLATQRVKNKTGKLSLEKRQALDNLNMVWEVVSIPYRKSWDYMYNLAKLYYDKYQTIDVPSNFILEYNNEKLNLGNWIERQKRDYKNNNLPLDRKEKLEKVEINNLSFKYFFNEYFAYAKQYYAKHHHLFLSRKEYIVNEIGQKIYLCPWLKQQIVYYNNNQLSADIIDQFNKMNMVWDLNMYNFLERYRYAKKYYETYGNLNIPSLYEISTNYEVIKLGVWINTQRKYKKQGLLSEEKIKLLEDLHIVWEFTKSWEYYYNILKNGFYKKHKHINVPLNYTEVVDGEEINLRNWIMTQRRLYILDKLPQEKIDLLNELNIKWVVNGEAFTNQEFSNTQALLKTRKKLEKILWQSLANAKNENLHFASLPDSKEVEKGFIRQLNKY